MVEDEVAVVIEREVTLLTPAMRGSADQLAELLDRDFGEIGKSGRLWTRSEMIATLVADTTPEQPRINFSDMIGRTVGPGLVLLTYVTEVEGRRARRSSLWRQSAKSWRVLHHQGTPIPYTDPSAPPRPVQPERKDMTSQIPESHHDLCEAPVATLATIGPDGRPQLSAVWFLAEDDVVRVSLNTRRQKTRNLQANPATNLFILDTANPFRYLEIRGDAHIEPDDGYSFAAKVGAKYSADLRQMDGPGESRVVVTILPTRVNAVDLSAG